MALGSFFLVGDVPVSGDRARLGRSSSMPLLPPLLLLLLLLRLVKWPLMSGLPRAAGVGVCLFTFAAFAPTLAARFVRVFLRVLLRLDTVV